MVVLKNIIKARTQRELEMKIADNLDRGWIIASSIKHFPHDPRPYQTLMKFETDKEKVCL